MTWFWVAWLLILLAVNVLVWGVRLAPPRRKVTQPPPARPISQNWQTPPPPRKQTALILPVASWPTTWVEEIVAHNGLAVDPYEFWRDKYAQTGNPADLAQMLRFVTRNP
jgi:hypothetical protein